MNVSNRSPVSPEEFCQFNYYFDNVTASCLSCDQDIIKCKEDSNPLCSLHTYITYVEGSIGPNSCDFYRMINLPMFLTIYIILYLICILPVCYMIKRAIDMQYDIFPSSSGCMMYTFGIILMYTTVPSSLNYLFQPNIDIRAHLLLLLFLGYLIYICQYVFLIEIFN